jgi:DNA-binding transcriptional LysR family regulator
MYASAMPALAGDPLSGGELAAFAAAVESGSVHGAGDALDLTQSAVTKRIQSLERRIGGELLERGRFGVRPTELGRAVYPPARRALQELDEVRRTAERSGAERASHLALAASATIGEALLPGWLSEFRGVAPEVRPALEITNSTGAIAALRERRAEIGFVEGLDPLSGWEWFCMRRDRLVVVVAAGHRWARRRSLAASALTREPYLTRELSSGTREVADAALAAVGVALTPSLEASSLQSLTRALAGGGFTLLSEVAIEADRRAGTLVGIPVRGVDLERELRAVRRRRPALTGAARTFWRWLEQRAARERQTV